MQNYSNHARFVPLYHFVAAPILLVNAGYALWTLRNGLSMASVMFALTALALVLIAFFARFFALKVQDRVIRLEMQMRLAGVLPADQRGHILKLSVGQMVGLRFAGDAELPALVAQALAENLSGNDIKKLVKDWQADYARA